MVQPVDEARNQAVVLSANEEIDLGMLVRLVRMARTSPAPPNVVVADMSRMASFNSTGAELLREAQDLAEEYGVTLRIVTATAGGPRLREISTGGRCARYNSVVEALNAARPQPAAH